MPAHSVCTQGFIQSGGPWNSPLPPSRYCSCLSGRHNSIPLIGPQCKSDNQPSVLRAAWERTHHPSHTLPLTMVNQPHGFPAIKKKVPPTKMYETLVRTYTCTRVDSMFTVHWEWNEFTYLCRDLSDCFIIDITVLLWI